MGRVRSPLLLLGSMYFFSSLGVLTALEVGMYPFCLPPKASDYLHMTYNLASNLQKLKTVDVLCFSRTVT